MHEEKKAYHKHTLQMISNTTENSSIFSLMQLASEPGVVIKGMWAVKLCSSYILWFLN